MSSPLPIVSVVIPVHNGRNTIQRCLDALMASEGVTPEEVVVDDASTDGTVELVTQYPVRLHRLQVNSGPAIPWTMLILSGYRRGGGLNLQRLFRRCRGPLLAQLTVPMLMCYYVYSSVAFGVGLLLHASGRRLI